MSIHRRLRRRQGARGIVLSSFGVIGAVAGPQLARAQNPPAAQAEEIIVTGSRVFQSGFDSAQPLTTIDSEQIQNLGIVNTGDIVRTLPQNTPFFTETNVGFGNFNVGSQLANLRGLNPFFGSRTLTLVDTRRVVPTTEGGAVDLTLIPSMLVGRTEVVTGGASAQYGSDAIAGVVNVILDKTLDGIKAQVDAGETAESDGGDTHASFAFGTGFGNNDKGHLLVGAEYQKQDIIGPCSKTRDWCKEAWGAFTNAQFNAPPGVGNGLPNFMVLPDGKFPTSNTGVFTSGGVTRQFNANGTDLVAYDPGRFPGAFSRQGGDGTLLAYDLSSIRPETERYSLLGHVDLDLTGSLRFDAEIGYAHSDAENNPANGALGPFGAGTAIAADNAFLTPAVQALAPAGGTLQRVFLPGIVSARNTTENTTTRFVAGLNGDLGEKWSWDVYYQHGENENHQRLFHNAVGLTPGPFQYMLWALDAVHTNPADPTSPIVCRAVRDGVPNAAGCVPLNMFGNGNASAAAIEYAFRTLKEDTEYKQDVVGANFRTTIAEGWAGPINFATGLEWRKDKEDATHDIPNQPWYSGYFLSYGLDRGGDIEVAEAYGEVNVPMSKKLVTDFSARFTQNEATSHTGNAPASSHDFSSWKATAFYDALDWLRFRATVSQDVRAAGFRELFLPRVDTIAAGFPAPVNNPWSGAQDVYLNISGGNPDLKPETADTKTLGMVLSFDRFRFSIDRFDIDLKDAITPGGAGGIGAQQLVQACFASGGAGAVCGKIGGARGANNAIADITSVDTRSINIGKFVTKGYDLEATYNWSLSRGGDLQLRMIGTYLPDMIIDTGLGSPAVNYHGQSGPVASFGGFNTSPDWQARAFVTWAKDKLTTTFETRYISSGKLNATWTESMPGSPGNTAALTVNDNSVDEAYYLAWSGSWDFTKSSEGRGTQLFWAINNLFDKDPPVAPGGNVYPTNPVFFDTLGLRYRVGVRFSF
jgi:outer membrane receptor protein involved in Fe transport